VAHHGAQASAKIGRLRDRARASAFAVVVDEWKDGGAAFLGGRRLGQGGGGNAIRAVG
jgi:hypothetical protein